VWTRDAVEAGFGLLAAGQTDDSRRLLAYLVATQNEDGGWSQNFFPDGRPHWTGVQLDQVALPIVLAECLSERGLPETPESVAMIRRAIAYVARQGPLSPQDRWEENAGASPFTLALEVAALVAAAKHLDAAERGYALGLADCWNERIEEWTYVRDTALAREFGVDGYYVRIAPLPENGGLCGRVEVHNRPHELVEASALVGLEFIYLARLGLRRADDPRIRASARVVDALLRVETPCGPTYHRYNGDGYGEHEDGRAYDGTGVGRGWPLLVGERGHLALLQGDDPLPYLEAMACMTGRCGLLPEQVWDAPPIPERDLMPGKPTGSAMPLVWAHAEFVKLFVARKRRRPLELLEAVRERYGGTMPSAPAWYWRSDVPFGELPEGKALVIEDQWPFLLHFGFDGWQDVRDRRAQPLGLGMFGVPFARSELHAHRELEFTRFYVDARRWEGHDHAIGLAHDAEASAGNRYRGYAPGP
jgi:glucoamylase